MRPFKTTRLRMVVILGVGLGSLGYVGAELSSRMTPDVKTVSEGRDLFVHEWIPNDPLAHGGDGLGPVFNAKSCVACHFQGGVGGGGPNKHNVTGFEVQPTRLDPNIHSGAIHMFAVQPSDQESLDSLRTIFPPVPGGLRVTNGCTIDVQDFDPVRTESLNTPALFGAALIDRISAGAVKRNMYSQSIRNIGRELELKFDHTVQGRARELDNGRTGKFGWKGQFATLTEFVAAACAVEVGLSNPVRRQDVPRQHTEDATAQLDLNKRQFYALVSFIESLPQPTQVLPTDESKLRQVNRGEKLFHDVGCADCHLPSLGGVDGIYSDLLLHRIADENSSPAYVRVEPETPLPSHHPLAAEWKTPPLWGVADSAPYFHDGQSPTLESAILRHGGAARHSTKRFKALPDEGRQAIVAFLCTLKAPQLPADPSFQVAANGVR